MTVVAWAFGGNAGRARTENLLVRVLAWFGTKFRKETETMARNGGG